MVLALFVLPQINSVRQTVKVLGCMNKVVLWSAFVKDIFSVYQRESVENEGLMNYNSIKAGYL